MAVSGSFDFAITGDQLIEAALRKARCISDGDSASANQLTYYRQALNLICKELVSENVGLFTIEKYPKSLVANDASFALPTKYVDILSAYVNYNSIDTPVNILTKNKYHSIPQKTMTGVPDNIMLDFTGTPTVYLYPVSNVSCTLNLVVYRLIDDFDESTNNPGMPVKWYMYLLYALTTYIAEDRELPVTTVDRFREEAKQLKVRAMGNDTEKTGQRVVNPSVPVV